MTRNRSRRIAVACAVTTMAVAAGTASYAYADADDWTRTETPTIGDGYSLSAVDAPADDDVWTVGMTKASTAVALHWDGSQWTDTKPPQDQYLYSVSAVSTNDVWAIGGGASMAAHWDGGEWTAAKTPPPEDVPEGGNPWLIDTEAVASDDVWAVGNDGAVGGGPDGMPFFEHWDGTEWTASRPTLGEDVTAASLSSVTGESGDDLWAVGTAYTGTTPNPLVLHYDGAEWTVVDTAVESGELTAVTILDGRPAAIGFVSTDVLDAAPLLLTNDGDEWTTVDTPDDTSWWYGLAPDGDGGLIGAGYTSGEALTLNYDGDSATIESVATDEATLDDVATVPDTGTTWVVGAADGTYSAPLAQYRG